MVKPVLLTVDDDPQVLQAIQRDLHQHYGNEYRILRADSGDSALKAASQLKEREEPIALFLADQRMPGMTGVDFLERAVLLHPGAKRVLLTAYADTDVAIKAINSVKIDYYLVKPWNPPRERLYPVLDDLLSDWKASFRPPFEGLRVVGHRWSPDSHRIKTFLARNQLPYQWLDVESDRDAASQLEKLERDHGTEPLELPVVFFEDGTRLDNPSNREVADKLGLRTHAEKPFYDLIIVGGGPAGLAAGVYGASEGLATLLVEREVPGGQAGQSARIENYLGFPAGLSGADLARRAVAQARRFGVEILAPQEAVGLRVDGPYRLVQLSSGAEISCHALLIATGVAYRRLNVPGADRLAGAGVYYGAAMTEAVSCEGEDVLVVGGANSAGQAAMFLSRYARKVYVICRAASLEQGMSHYLVNQIRSIGNIEPLLHSSVVRVEGASHLEAAAIANSVTGEEAAMPASSLFVFIGAEPQTDWLRGTVATDEHGFILTGRDLLQDGSRPPDWKPDRDPYLLETSVPGIFVAGDVRCGAIRRVASGVGEGSIAIMFIHQYLSRIPEA